MPLRLGAVTAERIGQPELAVMPVYAAKDRGRVDTVACESLQVDPSSLNASVQALRFPAECGSVAYVVGQFHDNHRILALVGMGAQARISPIVCRKAAASVTHGLSPLRSILWPPTEWSGDAECAAALVEGALLGSYAFARHGGNLDCETAPEVVFVGVSADALDRGRVLAEATALARDLTNAPPAELTPRQLADRAMDICDRSPTLSCRVWDEHQLAAEGFGGFVALSQGSTEPPRLIRIDLIHPDAVCRLAVVGKAVTFDAGGINLKTDPDELRLMKFDKAGGSAVLGAITAADHMGPRISVTALLLAAENMPSGSAYKPGDVITHFGGRTTEVTNTDCEGRLLIADALAYLGQERFDAVVDVATLTGSVRYGGAGHRFSAVLGNRDSLCRSLLAAAEVAGEPMWQLPLSELYSDLIRSDVADVRQEGRGPYARPITTSLYLASFVPDGQPWAHIEIGGTAYSEDATGEFGGGATGVPTRTLVTWFTEQAACSPSPGSGGHESAIA